MLLAQKIELNRERLMRGFSHDCGDHDEAKGQEKWQL